MTQEELFQINTLHRDIQIYEAVKKEDTLINVGSLSENERQALYTLCGAKMIERQRNETENKNNR